MTTQCQKPRTPFCSCSISFWRGFFWKKLSTPTLHTSRTRWKPACQLLPKACHLQEGTHRKPTSESRIRKKKKKVLLTTPRKNKCGLPVKVSLLPLSPSPISFHDHSMSHSSVPTKYWCLPLGSPQNQSFTRLQGSQGMRCNMHNRCVLIQEERDDLSHTSLTSLWYRCSDWPFSWIES